MLRQTNTFRLLVIVLFGMATLFVVFPHKATAAAGINQQMAFQGKVVLSNNTNIPNGTYNLEFKIYDGGTSSGGGTLKWTEDRLIGGTGGVTITDGTFTVNLGSANPFGGSVDWNSDTMWLSLQVGNTSSCTIVTNFTTNCAGDGEMTPYIRLTAVPYAFNSMELGGVTASGYGQLANNQSWTGINTYSLTGGNAVAITGAPVNTATVSLVQLGNSIAGGNVAANGGTYLGINEPASGAGSAADFLDFQNNGAVKLQLTSTGALAVAGAITAPTATNTLNGLIINAGALSGVTSISQIFASGTNGANASASSVTNTNAGATLTTVNAQNISLVGTSNTNANANTINGINFANVATLANNTFNGINFGTGFNNGINFTSATGFTNFLTSPTITLTAGGAISGVTGITQTGVGANSLTGATAVSNNLTINTSTGNQLSISSGTNVPTVDQVVVDNTASTGVTTAGINGVNVKYKGGAAAVEAAGMRIDFTPGTTSGGTWSGMRIVANTTGAVAGVSEYGIKLEGPTAAGAGTEEAVYVGTGWDIGVDIQSGGMQLAAQAEPAVPAAGNLRIYAKDIAGRVLPKWVGPSGVDTPFQANLGFNRVSFSEPTGTANCSTGATGFGSTSTGAGTCTVPALTTTNLLTSVRRLNYSSGVVAGTVSYQRQSQLQVWRGNVAGRGGFFYTTRFGTDTLAVGNRAFIGLADTIANPTNIDPTTSITYGKIGMAINASTGNWNIISNVIGTAPTVTNLGASFPVNTTDLYELILFSAPNGSSIGWRVTDISTGAQTSGSIAANMPANTTFLNPIFWITNNVTGGAAIIDFSGWYLESDN